MKQEKKSLLFRIMLVISVAMCVFQVWTAATTNLEPMAQRSVHLGFTMVLLFLYWAHDTEKKPMKFLCYILAVVSVMTQAYVFFNWYELSLRPTMLIPMDYVAGIATIILIILGTVKLCGIWLPLVSVIFILYSFVGPHLSGILRFTRISFQRFISTLFIGSDGIYGTILGTSATFAFMFVLFGEFLVQLGAGRFITEIAQVLCGRVRGGTAKMSIVASGLFGMVSGSPLANVSATGSIYIPIMKENGFSAEYAGAVNATACTGGQIMPPVMGTGAFIMATMIGCSYGEICSAAAITAVLFYAALFVMVDLEAAKRGIKGLSKDELPKGKEVMKEGWHYLVSVVVLVWLLVFLQWSAGKAAFWAIVSLFGVYLAKQLLIKGKIEWMKLVDIAVSTAKGNMSIAIACACAGIVVGCFTATGLNLRLSSMLIEISGGNLFVLLLGCMVIAVIMGMGLSSTPVYILLSVMVAPAISSFGVPKLAAHLFIFFFASMATITPPVGMAFYVASGIAKSNSMKTGLVASMLGATGFLIPFVFVYDPALLMQGTILEIVLAAGRCAIGILGLSVAAEGYFRRPVNVVFRVLLIAGSFGSILPEVISTIVGIAVVLIILAIHLIPERKADVPA